MSVASPPVSVEKFRNRIDASSRATVFEVVQGNDKLLDTLRLPDTDDMRSSRNRTFALPASAAAASGQTRKDSKAESDHDIPSSALGCPPGPLVSCFEFIGPARFYGQVMAAGRRPASHAERIVPGRPLISAVSSGVTARVSSNQTYSSNCRGRLVLEIMARELGFGSAPSRD